MGKQLPLEAATTHFCFIGATGSGKTVSIRLLIQSAFPLIGKGYGHRAIVYDAKRDILPVLGGMMDSRYVVTFNPFDKRSVAWDMAQDITTPANALQLATILIPIEKNASQPFFGDAARHLLTGVIISFILTAPGEWTFRDVVWAMLHNDILIEVLNRREETKKLVKLYFSHEGTAQNIMSTVATKMNAYSIIAALWDRAKTKISLRHWLQNEYVIVLGNDYTNRAAVDAINQVIFKRVSELILDRDDISEADHKNGIAPLTWVVLDEFVRAGKLDGAVELATEGRSKGAAMIFGFQDINGARAVYTKEVTEEIIGQCSNVVILRLQSPETAEWASNLFGKNEAFETEISVAESKGGSSGQTSSTNWGDQYSQTTRRQERQAVLTSQFLNLPLTSRDTGLTGYFYSPFGHFNGIVRHYTINGNDLFASLAKKKQEIHGVVRRPGEEQYLPAWTLEDFKKFGLEEVWKKNEITELKITKEKRSDHIKQLAFAAANKPLTIVQKQEIDNLEKVGKRNFYKELRKLELENHHAEKQEKQEYLRNLAELWTVRNPSEEERQEISELSEDEQQEFYGLVEDFQGEMSGYAPKSETSSDENSNNAKTDLLRDIGNRR